MNLKFFCGRKRPRRRRVVSLSVFVACRHELEASVARFNGGKAQIVRPIQLFRLDLALTYQSLPKRSE